MGSHKNFAFANKFIILKNINILLYYIFNIIPSITICPLRSKGQQGGIPKQI